MYALTDIIDWDENKLRNWLNDPTTMEGWDYDFKEKLPKELHGKNRLRETVCAFANTSGGLLFFGVDDNKLTPGLPYDKNFKTKLNNILGKNIFPPIRSWDLLKVVNILSSKTSVFIVIVRESPYTDKPHMCSSQIFVRDNGSNVSLNNGLELRRRFAFNKFSPHLIELLEIELGKIKYSIYNPDYLDVIYLKQLKHYLEERQQEAKFNDLLIKFGSITSLIERLSSEHHKLNTVGIESLRVSDDSNLQSVKSNLGREIEEFIKDFKKVHGL